MAKWYDLANHLLSCGADFRWRKRAAQIVADLRPRKVADLATGTGDLAIAVQRVLPDAEITGVDFSLEMLTIARSKGVRNTVVADVLALPFTDGAFDCVTIAFGLRNIQDWSGAVREMARILKPGGHLLVLEFSLPRSLFLRAVYRIYLHRLLPLIAALVTRSRDSYRYLGASIENFPDQSEMTRLLENSGFVNVGSEPLTGGIVTLFTAAKTS